MKKIIFTTFLVLFFLVFSNGALGATGGNAIQIDLSVVGCNYNGICEAGENITSCPSDCTPPPTTGSILPNIYIYDLTVETDFTSAILRWKSSTSTISTIKWGETTEVKMGAIQSIVFVRDHKMEIQNLNPGTRYFFVIESEDAFGRKHITPVNYFFTKFLKDTAFPQNPINFTAEGKEEGIILSWQNPPDENFDYVRITRFEDRFRGDPFLGKLIYEGSEEKFLDQEVIPGKKYYYVLFAKDTAGNFSSGVGASATAFSSAKKIISFPLEEKISSVVILSPQEFFVHQYNQQVELLNKFKPILIKNNLNTIVDTNLKTKSDDWMKVVKLSGEPVGEYLFSFNKDSGRWQSVIPPLTEIGNYWVEIYRYNKEIKPEIISQGLLQVEKSITTDIEKRCNTIYCYYWFWIVLFLALFLMLFYLLRKKKESIK